MACLVSSDTVVNRRAVQGALSRRVLVNWMRPWPELAPRTKMSLWKDASPCRTLMGLTISTGPQ
jgi:hypothetical protein